jgi:uncharacterized protein (TIGR02594 family)
MTTYTVRHVQERLNELGYVAGPVDGIRGKRTITAIRRFQISRGLHVDGIAGRQTLAELFRIPEAIANGPDDWPWLAEGLRVMGYHEVSDNARLKAWLASDGRTLGNPAKLPWCGDFVETAVLRALPFEPVPPNPYWARNWQTFGIECKPMIGAIMVFSRGPDSGHVGFYMGETSGKAGNYIILGGNQSNRVSKSQIAKSRLLAARWPSTVKPASKTRLVVDATGITETTNEE